MSTLKSREELLNSEAVRQQIAERAYYISESNGFAPGRETEFWLSAEEAVISDILSNGGSNGAAPAKKAAPKAKAAPKTAAPKAAAPAPAAAPKAAAKPKATKPAPAPVAEAAPAAPKKRTTKKSA